MCCNADFVVDFFSPLFQTQLQQKNYSALSQNIQQYYWEMSDAEKTAIITEYYRILKILFCD